MHSAVLPEGDWLFFYSPGSVDAFQKIFQSFPSKYNYGSVAPGTNRELEKYGLKPAFVPESMDIEENVRAFAARVGMGETVITPVGNRSGNRLKSVLSEDQLKTVTIYNTVPAKEIRKSSATYLVFTSPTNAEFYFDRHGIEEGQCVVAIGQTTKKALAGLGFDRIVVSETPSEEGIWQAIQADVI